MRVRGLSLALLLATGNIADAQTTGSFEIAGFGRATRFDNVLQHQEEIGGGGSLGFYMLRNLAMEVEGAYTSTHEHFTGTPITHIPLRGRLTYHVPLGGYRSALRVGAGYVRNLYRDGVNFDDNGLTGVVGIRWGLSPSYAIRLEGTADYVAKPEAGRVGKYLNLGTQVGVSFLLGGSTDSDSDKDGVRNSDDDCPRTPLGKSVDSTGCARSQLDSDRDRVNDENDRCPDTASGEAVDPAGCAQSQLDADRDGVTEMADRCPATPSGAPVDPNGCSESQKDTDLDGVMNSIDRCPNSRPGEQVDPYGCRPGPRDSDSDGVADSSDQCPGTAAGELVNARGCPRDGDADGVPDLRDRCPSTPAGQPIDANGCPILFERGARKVVLRGVTFQTGKATLTPAARAVLRDIALQLVENPDYRVQISGHTDNTGSRAANLRLSIARARTVETFLEANGVPRSQITSKGFGPDVPVVSNKTAAGRAQNRRVELHRTN